MAGMTAYSLSLGQRARWIWDAGFALKAFLLITIGSVVLIPLGLLVLNSFQVAGPNDSAELSLQGWRMALSEEGILRALWNTVTLTVGRQTIALVVAIFFAWLIARTNVPGRRWMEFAIWTVFFLPALPMTLSWILLLDPNFGLLNELVNSLVGVRPFNIYSWGGIVWIHLVTGSIAIKVVLLVPAFRNLDASLEEASRTCGMNTAGTVWRVSIPLVFPAIIIVTLMSVATSLQAFEVELILGPQAGIDVYSTMMYRFINQDPAQFGPATALGVLVTVAMIPFALWQYHLVSRRSVTTVSGSQRTSLVQLGPWKWLMFGFIAIYLTLSLFVPSVLLLISTFMKYFGAFNVPNPWTLDQWKAVFTDPTFFESLGNTLMLGIGSALLAVVWFSLAAYVIVRNRGAVSRALDFFCWLPWAIPGVIIGLGFLWMVLGIDFLKPLHSTMAIMILAVTLGAITPGTQMLKASLLQINSDLEAASRIGGASWIYTFRRIVVPLLMPTMVAVAILTFVSAVRDIGRIVFVVGGTNRPLALLQLDFMASERLEAAAVLGVVVMVLCVGVAILARVGGLAISREDLAPVRDGSR